MLTVTAQLQTEKNALKDAFGKIRELEQQLLSLKIKEENQRIILKESIEARESEKREQDLKALRQESQKTIEVLQSNLEFAHKRIQTVSSEKRRFLDENSEDIQRCSCSVVQFAKIGFSQLFLSMVHYS